CSRWSTLPESPTPQRAYLRVAGLEARPGPEAAEIDRDLATVKKVAVLEQIAEKPRPVGHLPGMDDLARHIDQVDRAVAGHRREQRIPRLRQRRVVGDQPGAGAADLLLVDSGHHAVPQIRKQA